jgi:hypothetical protein
VIEGYNAFVAEWNRREADLQSPLPSSSDDWSPVLTSADFRYRSGISLQLKGDPTRQRYWLFPKKRNWQPFHAGWSFLRNFLPDDEVRAVCRIA